MAFTGKGKPPKEGVITATLEMKNLGIDNKTLMIVDERLPMVQKMELRIGEVVEYRQLYQGVDKGKINFIARKDSQEPVTAPPAEPEKPAAPKREPVMITGKYVKKAGTVITLEGPEGPADIPADLDVIKILSKQPPNVNAGDVITLQMIDDGKGGWVAKRIAPGAPDGKLRTAKDLLQENLDKKKAEEAAAAPPAQQKPATPPPDGIGLPKMCVDCEIVHDCPLLDPRGGCLPKAKAMIQKAKEDEAADQRMKENEAEAIRLANEKTAKGAAGQAPEAPVSNLPAEPQTAPQTADMTAPAQPPVECGTATTYQREDYPHQVHPGANVTVNPLVIDDSFRQAPPECPVELKIHLDCGSYSNFDMTVPAMPIDQAIARVEADGKKAIALMHRLMAASKKGF
jgi:hypothetical protein